MNLISEEYRAENKRQHDSKTGYGIRGYKHLQDVVQLAKMEDCATVLDYGCGQNTLAAQARRVSPATFFSYDPSVPEYSLLPEPADLVVCTDVLEHIEPLCLNDVIEHLASLTKKAFYFQIACRPAARKLSDGRNAHLLVKDPLWWFDVLRPHFDILNFKAAPGNSVAITGRPLGQAYP